MDYKWYFKRRKWKLSSWVKVRGLKTVESVDVAIGGMGLFNKPDADTIKNALMEAWNTSLEDYQPNVNDDKEPGSSVEKQPEPEPTVEDTQVDEVPDLEHYEPGDDNFSTESTVIE
jgi:hypothetical protein